MLVLCLVYALGLGSASGHDVSAADLESVLYCAPNSSLVFQDPEDGWLVADDSLLSTLRLPACSRCPEVPPGESLPPCEPRPLGQPCMPCDPDTATPWSPDEQVGPRFLGRWRKPPSRGRFEINWPERCRHAVDKMKCFLCKDCSPPPPPTAPPPRLPYPSRRTPPPYDPPRYPRPAHSPARANCPPCIPGQYCPPCDPSPHMKCYDCLPGQWCPPCEPLYPPPSPPRAADASAGLALYCPLCRSGQWCPSCSRIPYSDIPAQEGLPDCPEAQWCSNGEFCPACR